MKIISGKLKGRIINDYNIEGTRPTQDRVKESVFAIIQNNIKGSLFLDLFSGSGSIGIEAISNGAEKVYFVDKNKLCINNIKNLINKFGIKNCTIINDDYKNVIKFFVKNNITFNIIYLDPPYIMKELNELIKYIIDNNIIKNDGLIIVETDDLYIKEYGEYKISKSKKYGNKYITILENKGENYD